MKILVVDDSKVMRSIVLRTLRQAGYGNHEIVEAGNGREALVAFRAGRPDLILSDWNMPEMNGLELLKAIRREAPKLSFGFVTSESTPDMRAAALEAGASFLITKPFTAETFQAALGRVAA